MKNIAQREEYNHCIDRYLAVAIIAKVPFIGIDYESTDKETAIKMLKNIPRDFKRDLWHFRKDENDETFIEKYAANGEYKIQKHGSMGNALKNYISKNREELVDDVVWERIDKAISGDKVLMFDSKEIGGLGTWEFTLIKSIEKAVKCGCTIILLDDVLFFDETQIGTATVKRLTKYGVMCKLAHPSEDELAFYLKLFLKKSNLKHPVKNKPIPIELSDNDIKNIAARLIGSNIIEAQKKFSCMIVDHLIDNDREKVDSSILN